VLQEARVRLGEKGDVKDSLAVLRAVEADLVGEDRLAGPRGPFDDVDAAGEEAAVEDPVEARDAAREPGEVWDEFV